MTLNHKFTLQPSHSHEIKAVLGVSFPETDPVLHPIIKYKVSRIKMKILYFD